MSDTNYNNDDEIIRRRQEQRRRKKREERIKKQKRNRIILLATGVAVLLFIVFGISSCVSSCSSRNKKNGNVESTEVVEQTTSDEQTAATQEQPVQEATLMEMGADVPDNGQDGYTTDSGVYIWNGQAFELFYGDSDLARTYAATVSNCRQKIDNSINVYNIVVPIHIAFGLPERLEKTVDSF